jgi:hypothetical protein
MSDHTTDDEYRVNLWMNGSLSQLKGGLSEQEQMETGASGEDKRDKLLSDLAAAIFQARLPSANLI